MHVRTKTRSNWDLGNIGVIVGLFGVTSAKENGN